MSRAFKDRELSPPKLGWVGGVTMALWCMLVAILELTFALHVYGVCSRCMPKIYVGELIMWHGFPYLPVFLV